MGVFVFVLNLNVLYLQSTAMTELLLLATMTAGMYELILWQKSDSFVPLIKAAFWMMLATLIRYEGWFLLLYSCALIIAVTVKRKGYKTAEGMSLLFVTLAGFGVFLWFLWNQLIFKDALYFIFGPYSASAQQAQLSQAGVLATKGNILLSIQIYSYALLYNTGVFTAILGAAGAIALWFDKRISLRVRLMSTVLVTPFLYNVLALYLGQSVLFIQGISGNTWFNVRYGVMMMPSIAVFVGYLVYRLRSFRYVIAGLFFFVTFFSFVNQDAVTIDDARVGSSQKNVTEVSSWLANHAKDEQGFILISAASHDAIIFSSGLPMKRFIHEGTGRYWEEATVYPTLWARWIIMRTNDINDITFKLVSKTNTLDHYTLAGHFPFADIYELRPEYLSALETEAVYSR
ncbi:MAG: hypothetical protein HYT11_01385 [Candidatus Levybacteria bacterium]|nr:hypothetical protein [Candidatus Levybacteria bacterium]